MKTIKEWFMSVEDEDIRNNLLEAMDLKDCDTVQPDFSEALRTSFIWRDTAQGIRYWVTLCDNPPKLNQ